MRLLDALFPSRHAARLKEEREFDELVRRSPSAAELAVRDAGFARWHAAVAGTRAYLRTADGHWLLDVVEGAPAESEDSGLPHPEGALPPVEVLTEVLTALGETVPTDALAELIAADAAVLALPTVSGHIDVGAFERVRTAAMTRVPDLVAVPRVEEDPAHRAFREGVEQALTRLGTTGVVTPRPQRAVSSVRWWPGRGSGRTRPVVDPLGLVHLGRHLEAYIQRYPNEVHEADRRLESLARGEGLPAVDPAAWVLSALRHHLVQVTAS